MTGQLVRSPFTVVDGGLSTALATLGHVVGGPLWTATMLVDRPDEITRAHALAVAAGADVAITSSYQASEEGFVRAGLTATEARRTLAATTSVARRSGARVVAASVGPFGATLHDGSEYHGRYHASWDEVRAFHRRRIAVLADSGADLFAVETIPGRVEAEIVVEEIAARSALPMWVSFSCADDRHTCAGDRFADAIAAVDHPQVVSVGVNCTAPAHVTALLASAPADRPFVVYPNHGGTWDASTGEWHGDAGCALVDRLDEWLATGARLIGGCCGVAPAQIASLAAARDRLG